MEGVKLKRRARYREQLGLCFYCGHPMWEASFEPADKARDRFGIVKGAPGSRKMLEGLRCTAEHLHRRVEGGCDTFANLVAAHLYCNRTRGEKAPDTHKEYRRANLGKLALVFTPAQHSSNQTSPSDAEPR